MHGVGGLPVQVGEGRELVDEDQEKEQNHRVPDRVLPEARIGKEAGGDEEDDQQGNEEHQQGQSYLFGAGDFGLDKMASEVTMFFFSQLVMFKVTF